MAREFVCPHYHKRITKQLLKGEIVLICMGCKKVTVQGSNRWVDRDHPQVVESLKLLAAERDQAQRAELAMMTSDPRDPRWTKL